MYAIRSYYAHAAAEFDGAGALYHRHHILGGGQAAQALGILQAQRAGARQQAADAAGLGLARIRITSYNVCYTKLLRR